MLGKVVVGMFPNRAAGLTGTVDLAPEFEIDPDVVATSQAVKVAPVAPAARVTVNGESVLRLPASAGPGVPLTCVDGADCVPSGPMALLGGMTISAGPATSTATAMSVAFASGRAPATLDGTLDGTPLRLGAGVGLDITDDANAHLRSLFGAPLVGHFARPAASFTQTRLP